MWRNSDTAIRILTVKMIDSRTRHEMVKIMGTLCAVKYAGNAWAGGANLKYLTSLLQQVETLISKVV